MFRLIAEIQCQLGTTTGYPTHSLQHTTVYGYRKKVSENAVVYAMKFAKSIESVVYLS